MSLAEHFQVTEPQDYFDNTMALASGNNGRRYGVHACVDELLRMMNMEIEYIGSYNEFRDRRIRPGQHGFCYKEALKPILIASVDLMNVVSDQLSPGHKDMISSVNLGLSDLFLNIADKNVNLVALNIQLVKAFNHWIDSVARDPRVDSQTIGLPLAVQERKEDLSDMKIQHILALLVAESDKKHGRFFFPRGLLSNKDAARVVEHLAPVQ